MKLSKIQAVQKHIKMWDWLAKHPAKWKQDYFEAHPRLTIPEAKCYFCEQTESCHRCLGIPILWRNSYSACMQAESPHINWENAPHLDGRRKSAKQMADGGRKILKLLQRKAPMCTRISSCQCPGRGCKRGLTGRCYWKKEM